jgi:hypothetical protein
MDFKKTSEIFRNILDRKMRLPQNAKFKDLTPIMFRKT